MATQSQSAAGLPDPSLPPFVPLREGERLTRDEFERRYSAMPELKKAELIKGVVYMPSPVRSQVHGSPHLRLGAWLMAYETRTPGVLACVDSTVRADEDNSLQPDLLLMITAPACGQAAIDAEGYVAGAPELVAEIAASTASIDMNSKLRVYRRSGVREYIVWRVLENAIDWFVLRDGEYVLLTTVAGVLPSQVFPGLWLNATALLAGDLPAVFATLEEGLRTPEHAEFLAALAAPRAAT